MNYKKHNQIKTKGLTKHFTNNFSILNEAKYFSSKMFENHLVFIPDKKYIKYFSGTSRIESWEKVLKT